MLLIGGEVLAGPGGGHASTLSQSTVAEPCQPIGLGGEQGPAARRPRLPVRLCHPGRRQRGFGGPVAAGAAFITYRQLEPHDPAGTHRLYSFRDVLVVQVGKRLLDTGVSLG